MTSLILKEILGSLGKLGKENLPCTARLFQAQRAIRQLSALVKSLLLRRC
jgi:hypothetical protein